MIQPRVYFPGLNALRFYAALAVVFIHIEEARAIPGVSSFDHVLRPLEYVFPKGYHAVTLFFVLSGFLITYLLLDEHGRTGDISIGRFYMRRALRILPLYYLIVFLAFVVMPLILGDSPYALNVSGYVFRMDDPHSLPKLLLFVFMLPNVAFAIARNEIPAAHLWSIGVEEQFYIFFPLLVRRFIGSLPKLLYAVILINIVALLVVAYIIKLPGNHGDEVLNHLWRFLRDFRASSFAVGAFGALLIFRNVQPTLRVVYSLPVHLLTIVLMAAHILWYDDGHPVFQLAVSVLYLSLILNIACNPKPLLRIENRATTFLGNLSYGVYMYHFLIINLVLQAFRSLGLDDAANPLLYNLLLYVLVFGLTLCAAALSYSTYERFFLRLKERFAVVKSGNSDKPAIVPAAPVGD